jgi:hypothetical protein
VATKLHKTAVKVGRTIGKAEVRARKAAAAWQKKFKAVAKELKLSEKHLKRAIAKARA